MYQWFIHFGYQPLIRYVICKYLLLFSRLPFFRFVGGFLCCANKEETDTKIEQTGGCWGLGEMWWEVKISEKEKRVRFPAINQSQGCNVHIGNTVGSIVATLMVADGDSFLWQ